MPSKIINLAVHCVVIIFYIIKLFFTTWPLNDLMHESAISIKYTYINCRCTCVLLFTCVLVSWLLPSEYVDREDVPFTCGLLEPLVMDSSKSVLIRRTNAQIALGWSWMEKTAIIHCRFINIMYMMTMMRRPLLQLETLSGLLRKKAELWDKSSTHLWPDPPKLGHLMFTDLMQKIYSSRMKCKKTNRKQVDWVGMNSQWAKSGSCQVAII